MRKRSLLFFAAGLFACSGQTPDPTGPGLEIRVAPLTLPGVADACYDLAVYNVASGDIDASALVWSKDDICADQYGDGRGAITYVGTCDASPSGRTHTVSLVLDGLCATDGCIVTDDLDTRTIASTTYQNPCPSGSPCLLERPCSENADTLVEFNLTIMRDADQGFFDVAVNFEDVFCSAKLDCVQELLHRPGGARDLTAVLGFACTSGAAETCLYVEPVTLDCGAAGSWTIDPSEGPGNITEDSPLLYGAAVYKGDEGFTAFKKSYWNVALGLDEDEFVNFPDCTLRWSATASENALEGSGPFTTPVDSTYPVVQWQRDILVGSTLSCSAHPLNETLPNEDDPSVFTAYTPTTQPAEFAVSNCAAAPGGLCVDEGCFACVPLVEDFEDTPEDWAFRDGNTDTTTRWVAPEGGEGGFARLTEENLSESGRIMNEATFIPGGEFSISFDFRISDGGLGISDGFALSIVATDQLLQDVFSGAETGRGLGYHNPSQIPLLATSALTIEIDTIANSNFLPDPGADPFFDHHIAVHTGLDSRPTGLAGPGGDRATTPIPGIIDGEWHTARVDVLGGVLRIYIDGSQVMTTGNPVGLTNFEGGYAIFTAAFSEGADIKDIDNVQIYSGCTLTSGGGGGGGGGGGTPGPGAEGSPCEVDEECEPGLSCISLVIGEPTTCQFEPI